MKLVIIESPGKISSLKKILGSDYEISATFGHCVDLPVKSLSVDIKNNFEPKMEIIPDKKDVIKSLIAKAKKAKEIFIATDQDREGAAIGFHIYDQIKKHTSAPIKRATYNQITKSAVLEAIDNAYSMDDDNNLVESQLARRVLDRLVGYKTSFITKQSTGGASAGRVQSVALRLLAEREKEIQSFIPEEYWEIKALLLSPENEPFEATLSDKIEIKNETEAKTIYDKVRNGIPVVKDIESKMVEMKPYPPFVTQSMISSAKNNFGWSNAKTMKVAQDLYELGKISYHRSDSYALDDQSLQDIRSYISSNIGKEYLPDKPNFYKNKASAQAAHTCIHPVNLLDTASAGDNQKLYELIWKRTIASQSVPSKEEKTKAIIDIAKYDFIASGSVMLFAGWKKIYDYIHSDDAVLPKLNKGDVCKWNSIVI